MSRPKPRPQGGAIRAFLAIEIDPLMRDRIGETVAGLKSSIRGPRWVAGGGMHLTLRFLGWTSQDALERIQPELRRAASACPRAEARVRSLGAFPERGRARVLWLGVELPQPVVDLQAACERAAVGAGFEPETRPFRSHLTLARWREPARRPDLPAVDLGTTGLTTLVLFRSELRPSGAVYTPLAGFPLSGEASVGDPILRTDADERRGSG